MFTLLLLCYIITANTKEGIMVKTNETANPWDCIYIYIYIAGLLSEKHLILNDFSNLKLGFVAVPEFNIIFQR